MHVSSPPCLVGRPPALLRLPARLFVIGEPLIGIDQHGRPAGQTKTSAVGHGSKADATGQHGRPTRHASAPESRGCMFVKTAYDSLS